jgi:hypothetical protein
MTTGAKVAIGCVIVCALAGIVTMVAIGGAAWWLKGKAQQVAGDITAKTEEIDAYEKRANANPFTEPADGVIAEPRFLKFMEARKAIYAVYEGHQAYFESVKDKKEPGLSDIAKFAGLIAEIRLAQAKALAAAGMSETEYRFIQFSVYKTIWAATVQQDTGKQPGEFMSEAVKQMGDAAQGMGKVAQQGQPSPSAEDLRQMQEAATQAANTVEGMNVPPANIALFHKYEADIKKYAMAGLAALGL